MPTTTPKQKVNQVKFFGGEHVEVVLTGDTFDDAYEQAIASGLEENRTFIHPYDNEDVIAGQGTVAVEILNDCDDNIDYMFVPIGGGGLADWNGHIHEERISANEGHWRGACWGGADERMHA